MHQKECPNCKAELQPGFLYCAFCGQTAHTHRLQMHDVTHELTHAFLHADKGFLFLAKELLFKPGIVAKEYVEGKRKKYFSPFSFLVIMVAVSTFFVSTFNLMVVDASRPNPASEFMSRHFNIVIFFSVPLIAFFSWLLLKKNGKNYAEHLAFAAFMSGERSLFFTLVVIPLWIFFKRYYFPVLYIYMGLYCLYFAWACMQFTGRYTAATFIKGLLVNILTQIIISAIVVTCVAVYYRFFVQSAH